MLEEIYSTFLEKYGKQEWWPVIGDNPKLEIIFGAILTQNTSWKNVEKAISQLSENKLIDVDKILSIDTDELAQLIKSSGYYNQKAKKLKRVCKLLKENPIEELEKLDVKRLRKLLLKVKGIGPETADSIILYAFEKPIFVVDAYTKRIFSRIGLISKALSYEKVQGFFHDNLDNNAVLFNEYHALIVQHAKQYCRTKPLCKECIIKEKCKRLL